MRSSRIALFLFFVCVLWQTVIAINSQSAFFFLSISSSSIFHWSVKVDLGKWKPVPGILRFTVNQKLPCIQNYMSKEPLARTYPPSILHLKFDSH